MSNSPRTGFTYFKIEGGLNPSTPLDERPFISLIQSGFGQESTAGLKYAKAGAKRFSVMRDIEIPEGLEAAINPKKLESSDIEIVDKDASSTYVASIIAGRWFCWSQRDGIRKLQIIAPSEDVTDEYINHIAGMFAVIKTAHKVDAPGAADAYNVVNSTRVVPQGRLHTLFSDELEAVPTDIDVQVGRKSGDSIQWTRQTH